MAVDIKKYSHQLRKLCEEYYQNNISYIEYRSLRNDIFDEIDNEQGLGAEHITNDKEEPVNDTYHIEQDMHD